MENYFFWEYFSSRKNSRYFYYCNTVFFKIEFCLVTTVFVREPRSLVSDIPTQPMRCKMENTNPIVSRDHLIAITHSHNFLIARNNFLFLFAEIAAEIHFREAHWFCNR